MDQIKEERVCIKFCANLGKSATETLEMIQQGFGDQSLVVLRRFNGMPGLRPATHQLTKTNTKGDPQVAPTPESVARIQELIRQDRRLTIRDFAEEVEVGYGTCQRVLTEELGSSPPTMKRSCLGSSLVMRAGFTVTTLKQSDSPPSGKSPRHQGQKRPDR